MFYLAKNKKPSSPQYFHHHPTSPLNPKRITKKMEGVTARMLIPLDFSEQERCLRSWLVKRKVGYFGVFQYKMFYHCFTRVKWSGKTFRRMLPIYVRERYAWVRTFSNSNPKIER